MTQDLVDEYGGTVEFIGKYKGKKVFLFKPEKDCEIGLPFAYIEDTNGYKRIENVLYVLSNLQ